MVTYKYPLPDEWVTRVLLMDEFANGGAQVSVKLKDGRIISKVLISNAAAVTAARGFKDLPFSMDQIDDIFQTDDDKNPSQRGGWDSWDDWTTRSE